MTMNFQHQVAVVTGAGQGIGRAIAKAFPRAGARVVIAECDEEAGLETREQIIKSGGGAEYIHTDVADEQSVMALCAEVEARFGKADILINNAGISAKGSLFTLPMADWDRVVGTNLRGTFMCCKYFAPQLIKPPGGAVVNIASTRALMSEPDSEAYAASKGGVVAMTHALAITLGPHGVRVNAISPGWIEVRDWRKSSRAE
jgi:NAD(P)-dependent dehydrogenase (short-subunit alcohol dehydrogenase family)